MEFKEVLNPGQCHRLICFLPSHLLFPLSIFHMRKLNIYSNYLDGLYFHLTDTEVKKGNSSGNTLLFHNPHHYLQKSYRKLLIIDSDAVAVKLALTRSVIHVASKHCISFFVNIIINFHNTWHPYLYGSKE